MKIIKQLTLSQIFGAVQRQRGKSACAFALVMLFVVLLFLIWPRYYGSEGRLFVRIDQRQISGESNEPGAVHVPTRIETNSVFELIKSRGMAESVVDQVGAAAILENSFFDWAKQKFAFLGDSWNQDSKGMDPVNFRQLSERERAASKLESLLRVKVAEDSNVISVFCLAPSADLAQGICDQLMKKTQQKYHEIHGTPKIGQRTAKSQLERQRNALLAAEKRIGQFRNENGFLSIDHATDLLKSKLGKVDHDLLQTNSDLIQLSANLRAGDAAAEKIAKEKDATAKFASELAESAPKSGAIAKALDAIGNKVDDAALEMEQQLSVDRLTAEAEKASLEARLLALKTQQTELNVELKSINSKRPLALAHQRDVDEAAAMLAQTSITFNETLQNDNVISKQVVIAQPANFLVKHVSPRGSYVLPSGLVLAGMFAAVTALYFERDLLSGSLRDEEVEEILQMPVLISLPKVSSQKQMVGKTIA